MEATFFDLNSITLRQGSDVFILLLAIYVFIHIYGNRRVNLKSNQLLSFLILQFVFMTINSLLISLKLRELYLPICFLNFPLIYYVAPTSYLYIVSLTSEKFKFSKKNLFHFFFPTLFLIFSLILNLLFYIDFLQGDQEGFQKSINLFLNIQMAVFNYFTPLQFVIYAVITIIKYTHYRKRIKDFFSFHEGVQLRWIQGFILGFSLFILFLILSNNDLLFLSGISQSYYDFISYTEYLLFIGFVGYYGSRQVNYYDNATENQNIPENQNVAHDPVYPLDKTTQNPLQDEKSTPVSKTPESFSLNPEKKTELKEAILLLINEKKIYLNPSLTIEDIATELQSNSKYISYVINDCFQKNFYTFVNEYRINNALNFLSDSKYDHYSIEGIGKLVGFKSKSSFNVAFKKQTGKTPTEFKTGLNKV